MLCSNLAQLCRHSAHFGRTSALPRSTARLQLPCRSLTAGPALSSRHSATSQVFPTDRRSLCFGSSGSAGVVGSRSISRAAAATTYNTMVQEVEPATLPGTPKNFSISEQELISKAQHLFNKQASGQKDPSALADDFRFEFPIVSLSKEEYLKATGTFNLDEAFPNMASHPYHWRVDPYEPNRVWFTTRVTATHSGPLKFFSKSFKPTNKQVLGAPECASYTFNEDGKCTSFTGGYIMDRRVGNTKKMGALFGILAAIGGPIPEPETIPYAFFIIQRRLSSIISSILGRVTFGVIGSKPKKS